MHEEIIRAINDKKVIRLYYSVGHRDVEPHAYGLGTSGNRLLRAYQSDGASESGNSEGWKLFKLDDIENLKVTDNEFIERPKYKKGDKSMQRIFAEL